MTYPARVVAESGSLMDEHAWISQAGDRCLLEGAYNEWSDLRLREFGGSPDAE